MDHRYEAVEAHELWVKTGGKDGTQLEATGDWSGLDLSGKVLFEATFDKIDLSGTSFESADLTKAYFGEADMSKVTFEGATLTKADLSVCNLNFVNFDSAKAEECNFYRSKIQEANLSRVEFVKCNFNLSNLSKSELDKADFHGSDFTEATINNVICDGTIFSDCDFTNADLQECVFDFVEMDSASLRGTDMHNTTLKGDLQNIDVKPRYMPEFEAEQCYVANSVFHPLHEAGYSDVAAYLDVIVKYVNDFEGEEYWLVQMENGETCVVDENTLNSNIESLITVEVNSIWESFIDELDCSHNPSLLWHVAGYINDSMVGMGIVTKIPWSKQKEYTYIEEDNENISIHNWDGLVAVTLERSTGSYTEDKDMIARIVDEIDNTTTSKVSHGRRRKARKALEEVKSPIHVQAFRKMFPNAYSVIQHDFSGTMTPEGAKALLDGYGISWLIGHTVWDDDLQRISPIPNDVLRLNVDMNALTSEEKVLDALKAIREVSYRSMHPVVRSGKLMTIGWVRYTVFEKSVLIEEVQSDLPTVRKGISEDQFKAELESKGIDDALLHKSLDVLEPFTQRFYEDAMALVFDMAEEKGLVVEMLTYETKEQFGSPKSIYSKLPKAMGMRQTTEVMSPVDVPKVWTIDPTVRANPVCACGKRYSEVDWQSLEYVGRMGDEQETLELRNCKCGSTIAIQVQEERDDDKRAVR